MVLPEEYAKNASVKKNVIGKIKYEVGMGYITEFVGVAPKVYAYQQIKTNKTLSEEKKARGTKKMVTKKTLSFDKYKKCIFDNETVKCIQYRIKSTSYSVDTTKIALKIYDNKRLSSFNGITTYLYGTNAFKVCFEELKFEQTLAAYLDSQKLINA